MARAILTRLAPSNEWDAELYVRLDRKTLHPGERVLASVEVSDRLVEFARHGELDAVILSDEIALGIMMNTYGVFMAPRPGDVDKELGKLRALAALLGGDGMPSTIC